jgi:biopolymer transport protein ExbB/TolQ
MLNFLTSALYHISNVLLVPVILGLLGLLLWTLLLLGGFLREWFERRKMTPVLASAVAAAKRGNGAEDIRLLISVAPSGLPRRFSEFTAESGGDARVLEQALATLENHVAAAIARHSFVTRIAPILGLMGTLIPLGPALSGLANGNMQALSGNLIVAFTATVVGLLISGIAFGMGLVRRVWYASDMTSLEFIVDAVTRKDHHLA